MAEQNEIKLFDGQQIRYLWDEAQEKYYFSIVDVIRVLTESDNPQTYWRVLKKRLRDEGNETVTNCNALKMRASDGKMRLADVANPLTPYKFQFAWRAVFFQYLLYFRTPPAFQAKYNFEGTDIASNPTSKLRSH